MEKCFQNITCFAWIKVISVLLYLKYWYYNTPYLNSRFSILDSSFPVILALSVKFHPGRLKSLFNTIFFMIFIGFPTLSYLYVPLLQIIFTSLFCQYLSIKTSLQSPLTLPSSIPQQFFTSLFLRAAIPKIFLYLSNLANSGCVKRLMRKGVVWGLTLF